MTDSSSWVRLVARRLCGGRSQEEWEAEARRVSQLRRQRLVDSADKVAAAREFLSLLEHPTPADLQRREEEEKRQDEEWQGEDEQRLRHEAESDVDNSGPSCDASSASDPPTRSPPPSTSVSVPAPPPMPNPSPVECFDALIAADVTVEQARAHRRVSFDSPQFDPVHDALWETLNECRELTVLFDCRADDGEIALSFAVFDERLHLAKPMDELEQHAALLHEAVKASGDKDSAGYWDDWTIHLIALAIRECNKAGAQVLDYTGGDTYELLLTSTARADRCLALIEQLGQSKDIRPYNESSEHDPQHCQICELEKKQKAVSTAQQSI